MNPMIPTPDVLPLPAPVWLLEFLLVFTFIAHVVPMNLLFGGSLLAALSHMLGKKDKRHELLARRISKLMPAIIAFTVTLGVAPLLFVQALYGHLVYSSSILMANAWFMVVPILIVAYYLAYLIRFKWDALTGIRPLIAWTVAILVAIIGFIYSNNFTLMLRPEIWAEHYFKDTAGGTLNWTDPSLYPRYLHMLFGAVAVAGLWIMLLGVRGKGATKEWSDWARGYGGKIFMHGTLANVLVGFWFLMALPKSVMMIFMGENIIATMLFMVAFVLTVVAWIFVKKASNAANPKPAAVLGGIFLLAILAIMAVMRHMLRTATLDPYFRIEQLQTDPQWGVFAMFAITLVIGLAILLWMIRVILKAAPAEH